MHDSILVETTLGPTSRRSRHGCNDLGTQGPRSAAFPAAAAESTSSRVTTPAVFIRHQCRSSCRKSSGERQRPSALARTLNSKNHDYLTSLSNSVSTTCAAAVRKFTPAARQVRAVANVLRHALYSVLTSGCGAVGSALPWGGRGRGFESRQSDQLRLLNRHRGLPGHRELFSGRYPASGQGRRYPREEPWSRPVAEPAPRRAGPIPGETRQSARSPGRRTARWRTKPLLNGMSPVLGHKAWCAACTE